MTSANKRRDTDIMKLCMSDYNVSPQQTDGSFHVLLKGPPDTPYAGGTWTISIMLPPKYPFKSPSVGFLTPIIHPNIDEKSGSICLDVLNQEWSPVYDLVHVVGIFIPQLLAYPNAKDPLNVEAAKLSMDNPEAYLTMVKKHVQEHAMVMMNEEEDDDDEDTETETDSDPSSELSNVSEGSNG